MLIIVEGPDGAGKTTLARELADSLPGVYTNQRARPRDSKQVIDYTDHVLNFSEDFIVVCDRFPLISDPIYDVAVRRMTAPKLGRTVEDELYSNLEEEENVVLVYCRPSVRDILWAVASSVQMAGVEANIRNLILRYDQQIELIRIRYPRIILKPYDWTKRNRGDYDTLVGFLKTLAQGEELVEQESKGTQTSAAGDQVRSVAARSASTQENERDHQQPGDSTGADSRSEEEAPNREASQVVTWAQDVRAFHDKMHVPMYSTPTRLNHVNWEFRKRFLIEELNETLSAYVEKNMNDVADGLIDLCYVAIGTLLIMGVDPDELWSRVQAANMMKVPRARSTPGTFTDSGRDHSWDVVKPEGWQPPDYSDLVWTTEPLEKAQGILSDVDGD